MYVCHYKLWNPLKGVQPTILYLSQPLFFLSTVCSKAVEFSPFSHCHIQYFNPPRLSELGGFNFCPLLLGLLPPSLQPSPLSYLLHCFCVPLYVCVCVCVCTTYNTVPFSTTLSLINTRYSVLQSSGILSFFTLSYSVFQSS